MNARPLAGVQLLHRAFHAFDSCTCYTLRSRWTSTTWFLHTPAQSYSNRFSPKKVGSFDLGRLTDRAGGGVVDSIEFGGAC